MPHPMHLDVIRMAVAAVVVVHGEHVGTLVAQSQVIFTVVKLVGAAGDSGGDLAMLQAAPFRIAINPNKSLAKHARENGWPIERLDSVGLTEGDCIARAMSKSHGPPDKPRKR